jgi:HEAT repeat protein
VFASGFTLDLDVLGTSQSLLVGIAGVGVLVGLLAWTGLLGRLIGMVQACVHAIIRGGFDVWRLLLARAPRPVILPLMLALLVLGAAEEPAHPGVALACGLGLVWLGVSSCLAYVHIDLERYEVARGYKALHSPLKGQGVARDLAQFGHRAGIFLLVVATIAVVGGFALTNYGLYHIVGRDWFQLSDDKRALTSREPGFDDFLAYSLLNLYNVVDLLHVASSYQYVHVSYVRQARWEASTILILYKSFFTLVLLQQVFASVRRGRLLSETVSDFWGPVPPLRERAEVALPQFGPSAVRPLLQALRAANMLTADQRERLSQVLNLIGPSATPHLLRHLHEPAGHVRDVAVAALGRLRAPEAVIPLAGLCDDPDPRVRESLATALGEIGSAARPLPRRRRRSSPENKRWFGWPRRKQIPPTDPAVVMLDVLRSLLGDSVATVRREAAVALGRTGATAAPAVADLLARLDDSDEEVRRCAAEALGRSDGTNGATVAALARMLAEPNDRLRVAAAGALGTMNSAAAAAVPALIRLLQSDDEAVRQAAAEAVGKIGVLPETVHETLAEGLGDDDPAARVRTAEAIGAIGPVAAPAAPALVGVLKDGNDRVRAKAVEALGRIGDAAPEAVPHLMRALRDQDTWVSALAAEALGEMGESAVEAIPALVRSLRHANPRVRANAAEALGKLGESAVPGAPALEAALKDPEDTVRIAAIQALGEVGQPSPAGRQWLIEAAADDNPEVRAAAVTTLGKLADLAAAERVTVLDAIDDASAIVRQRAAAVLPRLGDAAAIQSLCQLVEDSGPDVRVQAVRALGQMGPSATAAGPVLARVAAAGESVLRAEALRAVLQIQPPDAARVFRAGLRDAEAEVRKLASAGLMVLFSVPPETVPDLIDALTDPESRVRANVARVFVSLRPLPDEAVLALLECSRDADDSVRLNAARALRNGPPTMVGPEFTRLLDDPNAHLRLLAAGYLLGSDPGHELAGAVLIAVLRLSPPGLRRDAIELVAALGPDGRRFRDVLADQCKDEIDPELSGRLAVVLESLSSVREGVSTR